MSKHTPGPWETGEASWNEEGEVRYTLHGVYEAKAADARLIGLAPDLYGLVNDVEAFGPDVDGMMWLMLPHGNDGDTVAVAVGHADTPMGEALVAFIKRRETVLKAVTDATP